MDEGSEAIIWSDAEFSKNYTTHHWQQEEDGTVYLFHVEDIRATKNYYLSSRIVRIFYRKDIQ